MIQNYIAMKKKKIGIYICHCGGNISDYVDVEKVRQAVESEDCVLLAKTTMFACSDTGQMEMVEDVQTHHLDGMIVASCSPKLHQLTFRKVAEKAGLNKYTYIHANIREQASWAHSDNKQDATEKVILLVKAAIAKARHAEALEAEKIKAEKAVAVIGGGVAGMKAALSLADKKTYVILVEKSNALGGHVRELGPLFMTGEAGSSLVKRLSDDVLSRKNIALYTDSEIINSTGSIGSFLLKIKKNEETEEVKVGSVVVATGFDSYAPSEGEFEYRHLPNVITLSDFKKLVDTSSKKLIFNNKEIHNIAYIYCVGSRQAEGNTYCSRYCCTATVHTAIEVKKKFGDIRNYHLTRGVRTYGKQEALYTESRQSGDIYLQWELETPPTVNAENDKTVIKIVDFLSSNREMEIEADLVVLVTGMTPRADNAVGALFKLPKGRDHFYNEIHTKLRPVETVIDGVTIAGTCQGPKNITESVNSALSAATKSYSYVSKGEIELDPVVAQINPDACAWCSACADACPFNAISYDEKTEKAVITNS
jgi:heterodisulfide reductase subunit A